MTIDSHVHFWKYSRAKDSWITNDMKILQQDYLPQSLIPTLRRNGIDGCVAVHANQSELETHFLVELSKTHDIIKGVVGWIDLQSDGVEDRLQYFSQYPIIKGWRHIVQSEADDFLLGEKFQNGIRALQTFNYTYDLLIYPRQMGVALDFLAKFPDQAFIIDHCAKPDIKNKRFEEWKNQIQEIARHPRVYCKLSGLFTEAAWKEWSAGDFFPYLDVVFESFGVEKLLFGSDWPVMLLSGIYVQWKSLLEKYMEHFSEDDRTLVFGENAISFYGLSTS